MKLIIKLRKYGCAIPFSLGNTSSLPNFHATFDRASLFTSIYEPRCEKTGLRGFRPGLTQKAGFLTTMLIYTCSIDFYTHLQVNLIIAF